MADEDHVDNVNEPIDANEATEPIAPEVDSEPADKPTDDEQNSRVERLVSEANARANAYVDGHGDGYRLGVQNGIAIGYSDAKTRIYATLDTIAFNDPTAIVAIRNAIGGSS